MIFYFVLQYWLNLDKKISKQKKSKYIFQIFYSYAFSVEYCLIMYQMHSNCETKSCHIEGKLLYNQNILWVFTFVSYR